MYIIGMLLWFLLGQVNQSPHEATGYRDSGIPAERDNQNVNGEVNFAEHSQPWPTDKAQMTRGPATSTLPAGSTHIGYRQSCFNMNSEYKCVGIGIVSTMSRMNIHRKGVHVSDTDERVWCKVQREGVGIKLSQLACVKRSRDRRDTIVTASY